jgi:hypothetical protein
MGSVLFCKFIYERWKIYILQRKILIHVKKIYEFKRKRQFKIDFARTILVYVLSLIHEHLLYVSIGDQSLRMVHVI